MSVLIETSEGDIVIDLLTEERPRSSLNFLKLCKMKMYNYCLFHDIQQNFIIQTGDTDKNGGFSIFKTLYGEQAKYFEREVVPKIKHSEKYLVSMVNNGNGFHGSQFLITCCESADVLDGVHTVFGKVVEGDDVIDCINEAYVDDDHRPYQDIRIHHTIVLHDPFDDPPQLPPPPSRSPSPPPHVLSSNRLAVGEKINLMEGLTTEEMVEYIEEKELKANTQMLEIIGDLPHADVKPPENVLFVCKLNPVTNSEDLEIIFSRFGSILSCEVIRDWKSGDSLCYAFIEFEEVKDCEAAYFKMDNVLIDERRIHVDFSQSVSRLYWNRNTKHQLKYQDERDDSRENGRGFSCDSNATRDSHNRSDRSRYKGEEESRRDGTKDGREKDRRERNREDKSKRRDLRMRDKDENRYKGRDKDADRYKGRERDEDRYKGRERDEYRYKGRERDDKYRSRDKSDERRHDKERKDRREYSDSSDKHREDKHRVKDETRKKHSEHRKHEISDDKKQLKPHHQSEHRNRKSKLVEEISNLEHKIKEYKDKKKKTKK